jgi:tRNA-splicing endonuclease subunit Sen34
VAQTLREDDKLRPMEIVAHGRLGTATKKSHLLCAVQDTPDEHPEKSAVEYWSIEWAGFG